MGDGPPTFHAATLTMRLHFPLRLGSNIGLVLRPQIQNFGIIARKLDRVYDQAVHGTVASKRLSILQRKRRMTRAGAAFGRLGIHFRVAGGRLLTGCCTAPHRLTLFAALLMKHLLVRGREVRCNSLDLLPPGCRHSAPSECEECEGEEGGGLGSADLMRSKQRLQKDEPSLCQRCLASLSKVVENWPE